MTIGCPSCNYAIGKSFCIDCGLDTSSTGLQELYMIGDNVWKQANTGSFNGFLCVGCIETRLGRQLTRKDFRLGMTENNPEIYPKSERLLNRLNNG